MQKPKCTQMVCNVTSSSWKSTRLAELFYGFRDLEDSKHDIFPATIEHDRKKILFS